MKKILFPVVCALIAAVLLLSAPVSSPPAAAESMTVHFDDGAAVWTECEGATIYVTVTAYSDATPVATASASFTHTVTLTPPALSFADGTLSWNALAGSSPSPGTRLRDRRAMP